MSAPQHLDLPPEFIEFNSEAPEWLGGLSVLVEQFAARWSLHLEPHFAGIRLNYVAPARRDDGEHCVLKISRHVTETRNEIAALRLWHGDGVARLLEADADLGTLLLERLEPGSMLVEVADRDDDAATLITAGLLRQLWRPVGAPHGLRSLESWCGAYDRNRDTVLSGASDFDRELFLQADAFRRDLLASTTSMYALHGDMHHFNVLQAGPAEWLAIDPKGLLGDRCFDVCQFFRNPHNPPIATNTRRLDIFCSELDLDRERTKAWALVHGVLDALWDFEEGKPFGAALARARATCQF